MATIQKIGAVYIISWFSKNSSQVSTATTAVNIDDFDYSCTLSCNVVKSTQPAINRASERVLLSIKIAPSTPSRDKKCIVEAMRRTKVWASYDGVIKEQMTRQKDVGKWKSTYDLYKCQYCARDLDFEVVIDFESDIGFSVKKESKRVIDQLLDLWKTKTLADVTFQVEDNPILAHSQIVASGSPVLAAMFQNNFKEGIERVAVIKTVKTVVFEKLLRFLYTGDADIDQQTGSDFLVAADVYRIDALKEECGSYMAKSLSIENATELLVLSHKHNSPVLYQATLDFMSENAKAICSRKEWLEVIKNYPELSFAAMQLMAMG